MKRTLKLISALACPALCLATAPLPGAVHCLVLDRIVSVATSSSPAGATAMGILEQVALGHAGDITAEAEKQVGLPQGGLRDAGFRATEVRICAVRKIGETALPEAVDFLKTLDHADLGTDPETVMLLRVMGHGAIRIATLRQIQDPQAQIEYLERTAQEMAGSGLGMWAVDQLCDRASLNSLPTIEKAVRGAWADQRDQEYIDFCKARIFALYGKPDRAKALGAVLSVEASAQNAELATWAIQQLALMHSSPADAELARFAKEIDTLPAGSSLKERLLPVRVAIPNAPRPL